VSWSVPYGTISRDIQGLLNFKRYPRFAMQVQNDSMEKEKEHLVNGGDGVLGYHHINH